MHSTTPSSSTTEKNVLEKFTITKSIELKELQAKLIELTHNKTGAQVMQIQNNDDENLFSLSFRTLPESSDGVAHILEHTVLCGSEKFPVKDPFFSMNRRSLNTFMNAFTGSDFTCYPASSQIPKDFYNLLNVYLDAVFYPKIEKLSFLQEGHRLEFEEGDDPSSPLQYKGIVFNEMKGALSSPNSRLFEAVNEELYPNLTYRFNSGGDPEVIPNLTYEGLIDFHKQYYHPARCLFFFYGNIPLEDNLSYIEEHVLSKCSAADPIAPLPKQPRLSSPVKKRVPYPIAKEEESTDKEIIALSWLTCHILEQEELLALEVIDTILMDNDASPLKKALLKSGLCKQAGSYLNDDASEVPFFLILRGCDGNGDQLEALVKKTLESICEEGIPHRLTESAIHQIELDRTEITGDSYPFGLNLFMRSALLRQQGGASENALMIHTLFDKLRDDIKANPNYLTDLIRKHLLNNTHTVRVDLIPSKEVEDQEREKERKKLDAIREKLSEKEVEQIVQTAKELKEFQKKSEGQNLEVLPTLQLSDIPKESREFSLQHEKLERFDLYSHTTFTNGMTYGGLIFPLPAIEKDDLPWVRLFGSLVTEVGSGERSYDENLESIQENTGGIFFSTVMNINANDHTQFNPTAYLGGKSLDRKADKLFTLLKETATAARFDEISRLKEIIIKQSTVLQASINQNALKYAFNLSSSALSQCGYLSERWRGLSYFHFLKDLGENFDQKKEMIVEKLKKMHKAVLQLKDSHLLVTCSKTTFDQLKKNRFYGVGEIEQNDFTPFSANYPLPEVKSQGKIIASPVAFSGLTFQTTSYNDPLSPYISLASCIFDNKTLHPLIREQGGAYGGGSSSSSLGGTFSFYSYRDPNIASSRKAFKQAVEELVNGKFDERDLKDAKFEIIQGIDSPIAPGSRGGHAYNLMREGRSKEVRQKFRDTLLSANRKDLIHAVEKLIATNMERGAFITFAGEELLKKENALMKEKGEATLPVSRI